MRAGFSKIAIAIAALCVGLAGCASTPKLNSTEPVAAKIDTNITVAPEMYYLGPGSGVGFMFGAIGGAITAIANQSPGESLKKFAEDNGIHIDQIVREEAESAFQQSGKLNLTDGINVSTLRISIPQYGFSIPTGFSSDLVPVIRIDFALVAPDGKTSWSAHDVVLPLGNPAEGKTPDEFRADPELIEASWRTAVRAILANIVKHM